jgi:hypothetical protein
VECANIKEMMRLFARAPVRFHLFQNQWARFVQLKNENPHVRLRSHDQLGPFIEVSIVRERTSTLVAAEKYFVELGIYSSRFGAVPKDHIEVEEFDGTSMSGAFHSAEGCGEGGGCGNNNINNNNNRNNNRNTNNHNNNNYNKHNSLIRRKY